MQLLYVDQCINKSQEGRSHVEALGTVWVDCRQMKGMTSQVQT